MFNLAEERVDWLLNRLEGSLKKLKFIKISREQDIQEK
jgi:hypothetical protein